MELTTAIRTEIAADVSAVVAHLTAVADQEGYNVPAILREKAAYLRGKKAAHAQYRAELMEAAASDLEAADEAPIDADELDRAYDDYTPGSKGFCAYVETHCGFDISRSEIERIGKRAATPAGFRSTWADEDWWTDANN